MGMIFIVRRRAMELENHSKGRRREKEEMMDKRSYTFLNFTIASDLPLRRLEDIRARRSIYSAW